MTRPVNVGSYSGVDVPVSPDGPTGRPFGCLPKPIVKVTDEEEKEDGRRMTTQHTLPGKVARPSELYGISEFSRMQQDPEDSFLTASRSERPESLHKEKTGDNQQRNEYLQHYTALVTHCS